LDFNDEASFKNKNPETPSNPGNGTTPMHNDSSVATSSSEITLMEENISAYCEPFGTAVLPQVYEADHIQGPMFCHFR
jgi:hypothetical protein